MAPLPADVLTTVESVGVAVTFVNEGWLSRDETVVSSWEIWVPREERAESLP
jgi:hypothetical protein